MTTARLWNLCALGQADPDGSLLARARRGDRQAFDDLRRRYDRPLRGFVARRVGPDAAEDLAQDVWLACWTGLSRFDGRSRFKAWVYGIAAHKCADHFRSRAQEARKEEAARSAELVQPDVYRDAETRFAVQDALSRLPDAQREVVELYYHAELTLAEVAEALGRNLNTVKYQFYRAHAQVAAELRQEGAAQI